MSGAFDTLGLPVDADEHQIREAYHRHVKICHPDRFTDCLQQKKAQDQLIRLNLAYEEALKASRRKTGSLLIPLEEAKRFAQKLFEQKNYQGALRQLNRAGKKDAEFYYIQGSILIKLKQYETAYNSYREAVRRSPNDRQFRQAALEAETLLRRSRRIPARAIRFIAGLLGLINLKRGRP